MVALQPACASAYLKKFGPKFLDGVNRSTTDCMNDQLLVIEFGAQEALTLAAGRDAKKFHEQKLGRPGVVVEDTFGEDETIQQIFFPDINVGFLLDMPNMSGTLIRNAHVVHELTTAIERRAAGKPKTTTDALITPILKELH